MAGLVLLQRALDSGRRLPLVGAGICFGLSVVVRQTSIVFMLFGAIVWLVATWRKPAERDRLRQAGYLLGGMAAPLVLMLLYLAFAGVLSEFWRWTIVQAAAYSSALTSGQIQHLLFTNVQAVVAPSWMLWSAAAIGLILVCFRRRDHRGYLLGFLACGAAATSAGFYFRTHYFVQLLPAVALLIAVAFAASWDGPTLRKGPARVARIAGVVLLLVGLSQPLYGSRSVLFGLPPDQAIREIYGPHPFPESIEIGRYLRAHSAPDDQIALFCNEPQILFYAHRRGATRYLYVYPLFETQASAQWMKDDWISQFERSRPAWVVVIPSVNLLVGESGSTDVRWFEPAQRILDAHYRVEGLVEVLPDRAIYTWGTENVAAHTPTRSILVVIYRRRDDAS